MTDVKVLKDVSRVHAARLHLATELPEPLVSDDELLRMGEALAGAVEQEVAKWQAHGRPQDWWSDVSRLLVEKLHLRNCCKFFACKRCAERRLAVIGHIARAETYLDDFNRQHAA